MKNNITCNAKKTCPNIALHVTVRDHSQMTSSSINITQCGIYYSSDGPKGQQNRFGYNFYSIGVFCCCCCELIDRTLNISKDTIWNLENLRVAYMIWKVQFRVEV